MLKIKLLNEDAKVPVRVHEGDAGYDVFSPIDVVIYPKSDILIPLGWSSRFPKTYAMVMFNKSGRAVNHKLSVGACVIDSGYRGEVHAHLFNLGPDAVKIKKGEKITQFLMLPLDTPPIAVVDTLDETSRGEGGFGSTGL